MDLLVESSRLGERRLPCEATTERGALRGPVSVGCLARRLQSAVPRGDRLGERRLPCEATTERVAPKGPAR